MIEFKDLFTVFKYLFSHSSSAEVAYRKLFDGALEFGAKNFVDSLLKIIPKSNNEFSEPAMLKYLKENKEIFNILGNCEIKSVMLILSYLLLKNFELFLNLT